jgi:hypothetical protein
MARLKALELRKTQAMERIEAKLDALLKLSGIDPAKFEETPAEATPATVSAALEETPVESKKKK